MKKHSHEEILLKLARADELARAGNSQMEIGKALGVSVMTLHRWRKRSLRQTNAAHPQGGELEDRSSPGSPRMDDMRRVLDELTLENQRLRKIVADLLLDKMSKEEAAVPRVCQARNECSQLLNPASAGMKTRHR